MYIIIVYCQSEGYQHRLRHAIRNVNCNQEAAFGSLEHNNLTLVIKHVICGGDGAARLKRQIRHFPAEPMSESVKEDPARIAAGLNGMSPGESFRLRVHDFHQIRGKVNVQILRDVHPQVVNGFLLQQLIIF